VHKPARPTQQAADYQQMFEKMQKRQSNNSKELVVLLLLLVTGQMGRKFKNPKMHLPLDRHASHWSNGKKA